MNIRFATVYVVVWTVRTMGGVLHCNRVSKLTWDNACAYVGGLTSRTWCIHRIDFGPGGALKSEVVSSGPDFRNADAVRFHSSGAAASGGFNDGGPFVQSGPGLFDQDQDQGEGAWLDGRPVALPPGDQDQGSARPEDAPMFNQDGAPAVGWFECAACGEHVEGGGPCEFCGEWPS